MNLCLSQLSWKNEDQEKLLKFLSEIGINKIECVFSKIDPSYNKSEVVKFKKITEKYNIEVYSAQSIFYGSNCMDIFDNTFVKHIEKVSILSNILSLKYLVFGSPNLRKINSDYTLDEIFSHVDDLLRFYNLKLLIEPNTKKYGGDFFFTSSEIVEFLKINKFSNISTMIDSHNSLLEDCNLLTEMQDNYDYIEHIHISEFGLSEIKNWSIFEDFRNYLIDSNYDKVITLEIKESHDIYIQIEEFYKFFKK